MYRCYWIVWVGIFNKFRTSKYPEFVDGDWDMVKMQPYIDWAAPMEYLLAFSFIATLYSFENELNGDEEE